MLKRNTRFAFPVALLLLVSACSGGQGGESPTESQSTAGTQSASADGSTPANASASALPEPETKEFSFAFTSVGVSSVPLLEAIEILNEEQGFTIETPEIAESELAVQGVFQGDFAFSSGTTSAVLVAIQAGGPLQIIGNRVSNEWTVYAKNEISSCEALDGTKLAIHSEGSVSGAMVKNWVNTGCGAEPQYLIVPGSQNRLAALLAGEIDASPLELADAVRLEAEDPTGFNLLTSFAETLPDLKPTTLYGSSDFMSENPGTTQAVLAQVVETYQRVQEDPEYLAEIVLEHLPEADADGLLDTIAERYVELDLFEPTLTADNMEFTIEFFNEAIDELEPGITVEEVLNSSYMEAVTDGAGG